MKKLCKSNTNRKICGVCGGIAEYLNADPTLIRLGFAIVALAAGSGVLAYFLAALIMPDAPEYSDRMREIGVSAAESLRRSLPPSAGGIGNVYGY